MRLLDNLAKLLIPSRTEEITDHQLVYRVTDSPDTDDPRDSWEQQILELCQGRSVTEIKARLYQRELACGASAVDIGLWRGLFDRTVHEAILRLVYSGHVRLTAGTGPKEERDGEPAATS